MKKARKPISRTTYIAITFVAIGLLVIGVGIMFRKTTRQVPASSYNPLQELVVGDSTWRVISHVDSMDAANAACPRAYVLTRQRSNESSPTVIHEVCDESNRAEFSLSTKLAADRPPIWQYAWNPQPVTVEYALTLHDPNDASQKKYTFLFVDGEEVVHTFHDNENDALSVAFPDKNEINFAYVFSGECTANDFGKATIRLDAITLRDTDTNATISTLPANRDVPCLDYYGELRPPSIERVEVSPVGVYVTIYDDVTVRVYQDKSKKPTAAVVAGF